MRISRRRIPVSVADISDARLMWLGWRYLSITARKVAALSEAAVQKVSRTFDCGSSCSRAASAHTGSRPVSSVAALSAGRRQRRHLERCPRLARVVVAAEPACAVGLQPQRPHRRVGRGEEVRRVQRLLGRQSRLAFEQQRLGRGQPSRAHEQVGEGRVRFVGAVVGQRDLERRDQFEVERAVAEIAQLDLAELDVVLGADPDRRLRLELGPDRGRSRRGRTGSCSRSARPRRAPGAASARPRAAGDPSAGRRSCRAASRSASSRQRVMPVAPQRLQPAPLARSATL